MDPISLVAAGSAALSCCLAAITLVIVATRRAPPAADHRELSAALDRLSARTERAETAHRDEQRAMRAENETSARALREEVAASVHRLASDVAERLDRLRAENVAQLDAMRATVEEKLEGTLDRRIGESFEHVSRRLEEVHRGLGEMQALAIGVGDLKRVMSNVKSRGGWAEVQLGAMLDAMLAPGQYEANVVVDLGSHERVEYAVRLPGTGGEPVLLPLDAKFPREDYERLLAAWEAGDAERAKASSEALGRVVSIEAERIYTKYVRPPRTTDFAVMYLPTEGLFAEVMRIPGLAQSVQSQFRVTVAGPTTLAALLNSLQMGFRTLAIQQRSSEVWRVLCEAKAEFQRHAEVWRKLSEHLRRAQDTISDGERRTRSLERKLRDVQELPGPEADPSAEDPR